MSAGVVAGPAPYASPPLVPVLLPNLLMLVFVLSGRLDLAGFTVALALEAFLYTLVTPAIEGDDGIELRAQAIKMLAPVVIAALAWRSVDWSSGTVLSVVGIAGTAVGTLGLRAWRSRRFFGLARQREYATRIGAAVLAALMLAAAHAFVRLSDAGWTPSQSTESSWLGAHLVQLGGLLDLSPEVTLTATMVVFFGFNEVLWAAWTRLRDEERAVSRGA